MMDYKKCLNCHLPSHFLLITYTFRSDNKIAAESSYSQQRKSNGIISMTLIDMGSLT